MEPYMELGHEFWQPDILKTQNEVIFSEPNNIILLSGRTALDYIITDIEQIRPVQHAYLPAYCCETMILPFIRHGITVEFYDIEYRESQGLVAKIDPSKNTDIFYAIDFFGLLSQETEGWIESFQGKGIIVIEDMTHSFFSKRRDHASYTYASLRKWTGIEGGAFVFKKDGKWENKKNLIQFPIYEEMRRKAFQLKQAYIVGNNKEKQEYLTLFSEAEALLDEDYENYIISEKVQRNIKKLDFSYICEKRRDNWEYIRTNIRNKNIIPLFQRELRKEECPLFFPVLILNGKRDQLRVELRKQDIYCPVHWPLSQYHKKEGSILRIYESELSLLCDQRYTKKDLQRMIDFINHFM